MAHHGLSPVGEEEAGQGALELGAGAGPGPDLEARCPGVGRQGAVNVRHGAAAPRPLLVSSGSRAAAALQEPAAGHQRQPRSQI